MTNYHSDLYIPCQSVDDGHQKISFMGLTDQSNPVATADFYEARARLHAIYDELFAEKKYTDDTITYEDLIDTILWTDRWGWNRTSGLWLKYDDIPSSTSATNAIVEKINDSKIFDFVFSQRKAAKNIVKWCHLQISSIEELQLQKRSLLSKQLAILHLSDIGNGHWEISIIPYESMGEYAEMYRREPKQPSQVLDINGMPSMFPLDGPPFL